MDQSCPQQNHYPGGGRVADYYHHEVMKKTCAVLLVSFFSLFCLLSCGLEAFYYIDYIPYSAMQDTTRATIRLPSSSDEGYDKYFTHFIIFYRIYISDILREGQIASTTTKDLIFDTLNGYLNSDYDNLYSITDKTSTDVVTSNLENTFFRRNYFLLNLAGANINSVLGSGSLGKRLEIVFSPVSGESPKLILNETDEYILQRAVDGPGLNFSPKPNRDFLNHPDLYNIANITPQVNPDVATNTRADIRYTYVSMYIAATGKTLDLPPKTIYSQATFIGVFRLAESS
jgi:hypothetical protein